jgi:hypothetical protein
VRNAIIFADRLRLSRFPACPLPQLASIEPYTKAAGLEIVDTFYDAAVSRAGQ